MPLLFSFFITTFEKRSNFSQKKNQIQICFKLMCIPIWSVEHDKALVSYCCCYCYVIIPWFFFLNNCSKPYWPRAPLVWSQQWRVFSRTGEPLPRQKFWKFHVTTRKNITHKRREKKPISPKLKWTKTSRVWRERCNTLLANYYYKFYSLCNFV